MGIYSHLVLPRFVDPGIGGHRERVNEAKTEITEREPTGLAARYAGVRAEMKSAKDMVSVIQVQLDACSELLVDQFEAEGITSLKMKDGSSVRVDVKPINVTKDREGFRLWCIEEGLQKEMHLHPGTARTMMCNMLLAGEDIPPGLEAFMKDKIVFTKAKS